MIVASFWNWVGWDALVAIGTLALASVTGLLARSTAQDVRASRRLAEAAMDEKTRRPMLTVVEDDPKVFSQVEYPSGQPYVRLLVHNAPGKRASHGTRVIVPSYRSWLNIERTLGSPSLGWGSAPEARDASLTIFGGTFRVLDLGFMIRAPIGPAADRVDVDALALLLREPGMLIGGGDAGMLRMTQTDQRVVWCLKLSLHEFAMPDGRDYLVGGGPACVVRAIVGSDEADAHAYDVTVTWDANAMSPDAALDSVKVVVGDVVEPAAIPGKTEEPAERAAHLLPEDAAALE